MSWYGYGSDTSFHHHHHHHHQDTLEAVLQLPETTAPLHLQTPAEREPLPRNGSPVPAVDAAAAPRKRRLRSDRHSKIRTAQGVRDRRMRLSVGVAQEFFALQDRLGFDKASKTVTWLLAQSKPVIDRLVVDAPEAPAVMKGTGEGSSRTADNSREEQARSGAGGGPDDGPPAAALMEEEEHGCGGELGWIMTEATAAAATTTEQLPPMGGLELECHYQYCLQLEEMMGCNAGTPRPW